MKIMLLEMWRNQNKYKFIKFKRKKNKRTQLINFGGFHVIKWKSWISKCQQKKRIKQCAEQTEQEFSSWAKRNSSKVCGNKRISSTSNLMLFISQTSYLNCLLSGTIIRLIFIELLCVNGRWVGVLPLISDEC